MTEIQLVKFKGSLRPAYAQDLEAVMKIKEMALVHADIKQPRNPLFHRKFFALLNFGFEYWEPQPLDTEKFKLKGIEPQKSFKEFRRNVTILAGYKYPVVDVRGRVHWEAESIKFSSMEPEDFDKVYKSVFNVIWQLVLQAHMTEQDAQNSIDELMSFL